MQGRQCSVDTLLSCHQPPEGGWKFRDNGHLGLRIRVGVGFLVDGILVRFLAFRRRRFKDRQAHAVNEERG